MSGSRFKNGIAPRTSHLRLVWSDGRRVPAPKLSEKAERSNPTMDIGRSAAKRCAVVYWRGRDGERQIDEGCERAAMLGVPVAATFGAANESGTTFEQRSSIRALLKACRAGGITHVIVKDVDRLSRRSADLLRFYELLQERGIALHLADRGKPVDRVMLMFGALSDQHRLPSPKPPR